MKRLFIAIKNIGTVVCILCMLGVLVLQTVAVYISDTVLGEDTDYIFGYYNKDVHWSITKSEQTLRIFGEGDFYYTHHIFDFAGTFIYFACITLTKIIN